MRHTITISLLSLFLLLGSCSQNTEPTFQENIIQTKLSTEDFMDAVRTTSVQIDKIFLKEIDPKSRLHKILEIQKVSKLPYLDFRKVMIKTMIKLNIPNEDQEFMVNSFDSMIK